MKPYINPRSGKVAMVDDHQEAIVIAKGWRLQTLEDQMVKAAEPVAPKTSKKTTKEVDPLS